MNAKLFLCLIGLSIINDIEAQIVPSSCEANDTILNLYLEDAKNVAVDNAYSNHYPSKDSIHIPIAETDSILKTLIAVYNAFDLKERDSVIKFFKIHHEPDTVNTRVTMIADSNLNWLRSLKDDKYPTGNQLMDTLYYSFKGRFFEIGSYLNGIWFQIRFPSAVNTRAIVEFLDTMAGNILDPYASRNIDGSKIHYSRNNSYAELMYSFGWEDCPSGCLRRRNWVFRVYHDCSVEFVRSFGDVAPEPLSIRAVAPSTIQVHPNPFCDYIDLDFQGSELELEFEVGSLNGRSLLTGCTSEHRINNLHVLAPGMYILKLMDGDQIRIIRILKGY